MVTFEARYNVIPGDTHRGRAAEIALSLDLRGRGVLANNGPVGEVVAVEGRDLILDTGEGLSLDDVLSWGHLYAPGDGEDVQDRMTTVRALRFALAVRRWSRSVRARLSRRGS